jgi:ferredoxin
MTGVTIGLCQGCGACLLTCPEHAIRAASGAPVVLAEACTGCGECIEVCPVDAISEEPRMVEKARLAEESRR